MTELATSAEVQGLLKDLRAQLPWAQAVVELHDLATRILPKLPAITTLEERQKHLQEQNSKLGEAVATTRKNLEDLEARWKTKNDEEQKKHVEKVRLLEKSYSGRAEKLAQQYAKEEKEHSERLKKFSDEEGAATERLNKLRKEYDVLQARYEVFRKALMTAEAPAPTAAQTVSAEVQANG